MRVRKRIDQLVKKYQKKCRELVEETACAIERIKEIVEESIGPKYTAPAPGNSVARRQREGRNFFIDSERAMLAIRNTVLNRSLLNSSFLNGPDDRVYKVSGEIWRVGHYVLLGPKFVYKDKTRPSMMYGHIGQIMEFLAVEERVPIQVFVRLFIDLHIT